MGAKTELILTCENKEESGGTVDSPGPESSSPYAIKNREALPSKNQVWIHHLLDMRQWVRYVASLCLSFLICKLEVIIVIYL